MLSPWGFLPATFWRICTKRLHTPHTQKWAYRQPQRGVPSLGSLGGVFVKMPLSADAIRFRQPTAKFGIDLIQLSEAKSVR